MIVLGDISGIQNYVFDIAEDGGGQARRLRARSFFVQLLAETAALRVRRALGWGPAAVLLCGAGKFVLRGSFEGLPDQVLAREQNEVNNWLLRETRGELRLTLAWADSPDSDKAAYLAAQRELQRKKVQPWAPAPGAGWADSRLILDPLDTPCNLCRHAPATEEEIDPDGEGRHVCLTCAKNRELGQKLPRARWLVIRDAPPAADLAMLGLGIDVVTNDSATIGPGTLAVANLQEPETCPPWCPGDRFVQRRLMAHVPAHENGQPVWFTELAERYTEGDQLLAVLKADADSLGVRFEQLLNSGGLDAMQGLSDRLDAFFAGRLRRELANRNGRWWPIYTIFAGGDDLIMVGPWNVMVDFAIAMRQWFAREFCDDELTLSAGLDLMKPKRPIKPAVERAQQLLDQAKDSGKDRLAAFGQVWQWKDHDAIIDAATPVGRDLNRLFARFVRRELSEERAAHAAQRSKRSGCKAPSSEPFQCLGRVFIPLCRGFFVPPARTFEAFRHALAVFVHIPQDALGDGMSLLGGLAIPGHGLRLILRHARTHRDRSAPRSDWPRAASCRSRAASLAAPCRLRS